MIIDFKQRTRGSIRDSPLVLIQDRKLVVTQVFQASKRHSVILTSRNGYNGISRPWTDSDSFQGGVQIGSVRTTHRVAAMVICIYTAGSETREGAGGVVHSVQILGPINIIVGDSAHHGWALVLL